jgi:GWxTD domain-containing protein
VIVPVLLLIAASVPALPEKLVDEDWADSPEAVFLTQEERADWKALDSRDSREAFKERYWLRRDPTAGTERNEFREMVQARIQVADQRFRIEKTPGSRTARGLAFVLFGSPSRVRDEHATPLRDARIPQALGDDRSPVGIVEGNETTSTWLYDRERTSQVVEAVGQPSFEVRFVIEPNRRSDRLQNPGLVHDFQEKLARRSILNPDLVRGAPAGSLRTISDALPHDVLTSAVRSVLESAPGSARGPDGSVFGSAILWAEQRDPETLVWFFLPPARGKRRFVGTVRPEGGGPDIAAFSERTAPSAEFSTAHPGEVTLRKLRLPPGSYDGAFAVLDEASGKPSASVSTTLRVPFLDRGFAVSSLLITRGPAAAQRPDQSPFSLGPSRLPPRADATFLSSDSLWYFFEVASPTDPNGVRIEPRLRRGTETVGGLPAFPAELYEMAPGRYLGGIEMSLSGFAIGNYVLYVTIHDGSDDKAQTAVRRAEFRILDR